VFCSAPTEQLDRDRFIPRAVKFVILCQPAIPCCTGYSETLTALRKETSIHQPPIFGRRRCQMQGYAQHRY
jgi:hypothetical protein